jgi:hypothetical protein
VVCWVWKYLPVADNFQRVKPFIAFTLLIQILSKNEPITNKAWQKQLLVELIWQASSVTDLTKRIFLESCTRLEHPISNTVANCRQPWTVSASRMLV